MKSNVIWKTDYELILDRSLICTFVNVGCSSLSGQLNLLLSARLNFDSRPSRLLLSLLVDTAQRENVITRFSVVPILLFQSSHHCQLNNPFQSLCQAFSLIRLILCWKKILVVAFLQKLPVISKVQSDI